MIREADIYFKVIIGLIIVFVAIGLINKVEVNNDNKFKQSVTRSAEYFI